MNEFELPNDDPPRTTRKKKRKSNVPLFILWVVLFPAVAVGALAFKAYMEKLDADRKEEHERSRQLGKQHLENMDRRFEQQLRDAGR